MFPLTAIIFTRFGNLRLQKCESEYGSGPLNPRRRIWLFSLKLALSFSARKEQRCQRNPLPISHHCRCALPGFGRRAVTASLRAQPCFGQAVGAATVSVGSRRQMVARLQPDWRRQARSESRSAAVAVRRRNINPAVGDADGAILYPAWRSLLQQLACQRTPHYHAPGGRQPLRYGCRHTGWRRNILSGGAGRCCRYPANADAWPCRRPDRDRRRRCRRRAGALALAFRLRELSLPLPAGLALLSPWVDMSFDGERTSQRHARSDAQPRLAGRLHAITVPAQGGRIRCSPLFQQNWRHAANADPVGSDELLLDDATRLAQRASVHGAMSV